MSEAENLLDQLADGDAAVMMANPETEPHIVIGTDRFITVPAELRRIGVQYDHNIETVMFDCPRYWDGRDLSAMYVYVNYMRSDGGVGMYLAEDVTVDETDENIMHFSWILSGNATKSKGSLSFLVCAKTVDDEGNEVNHWNSELNREMTISEGLEVQEAIINQYPDIITNLLVRMRAVEVYYEDFKRISAETKQYVDDAIANSDVDLTGYATEAYVDGKETLLYEEIGNLSDRVGTNQTNIENIQTDLDGINGHLTSVDQDIETIYGTTENIADYIVEQGTVNVILRGTDNTTPIDAEPMPIKYRVFNSGIKEIFFSQNNKAFVYTEGTKGMYAMFYTNELPFTISKCWCSVSSISVYSSTALSTGVDVTHTVSLSGNGVELFTSGDYHGGYRIINGHMIFE